MKLAVVGTGLVSPSGLTPRDHAFFLRAGVPPLAPSPFLLPNDESLSVACCPWLRADMPIAERLIQLSEGAVEEALFPMTGGSRMERMKVLLCVANPRAGLTAADQEKVKQALAFQAWSAPSRVLFDAASVFVALKEADELLTGGSTQAVLIVAVDSFVSVQALIEHATRRASPWRRALPPPSEAAVAILVTTPAHARRTNVVILGTIEHSAVAAGAATDENDEPTDGRAMASLLWDVPRCEPVASAFGQAGVDSLRELEWQLAVARNALRFDRACAMIGVENKIGLLGAAAGAFQLAYGLAALRHETLENAKARRSPFLAWAMSRDGTRGLAMGSVEP